MLIATEEKAKYDNKVVLGLASQLSGSIICPFLRPMIDPQSIILLHCWLLIKKHFPG